MLCEKCVHMVFVCRFVYLTPNKIHIANHLRLVHDRWIYVAHLLGLFPVDIAFQPILVIVQSAHQWIQLYLDERNV